MLSTLINCHLFDEKVFSISADEKLDLANVKETDKSKIQFCSFPSACYHFFALFVNFFRIPLVVNSEAENIKLKVLSVLKSDCSNSMKIIALMVSHIAKFQRVIVTRFKRILGFEQIRSRVELVVQTFDRLEPSTETHFFESLWAESKNQTCMLKTSISFFFFHFSLGSQLFAGKKKLIKDRWRCETDDLDIYHINLSVV